MTRIAPGFGRAHQSQTFAHLPISEGGIIGGYISDYLINLCKISRLHEFMAEEVGFEPTVGFHLRRFSRPVH